MGSDIDLFRDVALIVDLDAKATDLAHDFPVDEKKWDGAEGPLRR